MALASTHMPSGKSRHRSSTRPALMKSDKTQVSALAVVLLNGIDLGILFPFGDEVAHGLSILAE